MQQITEFIVHHWALWLTLAVLIVALIYIEFQTKILGARGVTARELINLLNENKVLVVDLRDKETYLTQVKDSLEVVEEYVIPLCRNTLKDLIPEITEENLKEEVN